MKAAEFGRDATLLPGARATARSRQFIGRQVHRPVSRSLPHIAQDIGELHRDAEAHPRLAEGAGSAPSTGPEHQAHAAATYRQ
jgi:hypothetical protein